MPLNYYIITLLQLNLSLSIIYQRGVYSLMDLKEEKELVTKARHNPRFFGQIYAEYYPKIFRYALKRIGDVRVAEDITSETFFKAINNLNKFKWINVSFSAWIYKIATNEINYYFRRGKYKHYSLELLTESGFEPAAQTDLETEIENLEAQLQSHKDFLFIQGELKKLPVKYQDVIALRYFENKKVNEIAEILGKKGRNGKIFTVARIGHY